MLEEDMNNKDKVPASLILDEEPISKGTGIEEMCRRHKRILWLSVRDGRKIVLKGLTEPLREHPEEIAALRKEYLLAFRVDSARVVRVYGFEQHPQLGPVVVMEYVAGEGLNEYLRHNSDGGPELSARQSIAYNIALAIADIHKVGISHRDLKPDNILIRKSDGRPVIIDFSHSDADEFVMYKYTMATRMYGAPEQQNPSTGSFASDIFSFGKILDKLLPEKRFKGIRAACQAEEVAERPDIDRLIRSLDPKLKESRSRTIITVSYKHMTLPTTSRV